MERQWPCSQLRRHSLCLIGIGMLKFVLPKVLIKIKYHQPAIHSFFAMPKSTTDVYNPKEPTSVSAMVLDGTADHSIDLTDC